MIESFKLPTITPETVSGSIVSFNDEYGGLPLKSCTSLISGYQEGSGIASPQNKRPLHAFSSADLYFNTINQWDEQWEEGGISNTTGENIPNSSTIRSVNYITVNPDTAYYFKSSERLGLRFYGVNRNYLDSTVVNNTALRVPANCYYIRFIVLNTTQYGNDISINYPATDTSYHAFSGAVFTFGQSIYQGSIDWKRGVVVANEIKFNDWNNLTFYYNSVQNFYRVVISDMLSNNDSTRCNIYNYVDKSWSSLVDYEFGIANNEIRFHNETITPNPTDFKNLLISQGVEIKYPLATPIEIPLGGINILTIQGANNIFCDTGDTTLEWLKVN